MEIDVIVGGLFQMSEEGSSKNEIREIFRREEKSLCQVGNKKSDMVENTKISHWGFCVLNIG